MGFLSGAYGKLMAGKLVRDLQYQMTSVQSQLRRVTKEVGDMEKMFTAQERNLKAQMQSQMNNSVFSLMQGAGFGAFDPSNMAGVTSGLSQAQFSEYSQKINIFNSNMQWRNQHGKICLKCKESQCSNL